MIIKCDKRVIITVIFQIIIIIALILPEIISSAFSVLVADDFAHGNAIGVYSVNVFAYIGASLKYAWHTYLTWQGTYFSMFMQALLSPVNNGGLYQLRIVMIVNSLLLWFSLFFLIWSILNCFKSSIVLKLIIFITVVYPIVSYSSYDEIFYWFSGAVSYSFPLSLVLLGISFSIRAYSFRKNNMLISNILGFLAMGGSLAVAGLGCYIMMLLLIYVSLYNKKINTLFLKTWIVYLVGSLINAIAPGNFTRHGVIDDTGVHPFVALINAIRVVINRVSFLFEHTNFIFIIIVIVTIAICSKTYIDKRAIYLFNVISVALLLCPLVTIFPVCLGYSSDILPTRCSFMVDFAIIMSLCNLSFVVGINLKMFYLKEEWHIFAGIVLGMMGFSLFFQNGGSLINAVNVNISKQILNKTYDNHYDYCKKFYDRLENVETDSNVVILGSEMPEDINYFYNFYLSEDSNNWVNESVATYYGLNSIAVKYGE